MIVVAVFPEIHALLGAEGESALGDRDGEVHGGEGGARDSPKQTVKSNA